MKNGYVKAWFYKAFNWSVLKTGRWQWIDYLRGIVILLVAFRHSLLGIEHNNIVVPAWLDNANTITSSFRMPLFFVLSGIFIKGSMAKRTLGQIIETKFENLIYPYLVWASIQITMQIVLAGSSNTHRTIFDYVYILYQPRNVDQFWYLPALFNASIVYMVLESKLKPAKWVHVVLGVVLYFVSHYFQQISMLSDWMRCYIFFALGAVISDFFFKESSQRFLKSPWPLLMILPVFVLAEMFFVSKDESFFLNDNDLVGRIEYLIIALIGCLSMFIVAFRLQSWNILRFLRVIGYHSMYIYVMHVMVAAAMRALLMKVFHITDPIILLVFIIFFAVTIPIIFYNLLINDNILWFLFSYRRKKVAKVPRQQPGGQQSGQHPGSQQPAPKPLPS
jgi:fucose 4-O-acetylase-like acetyltransferase